MHFTKQNALSTIKTSPASKPCASLYQLHFAQPDFSFSYGTKTVGAYEHQDAWELFVRRFCS